MRANELRENIHNFIHEADISVLERIFAVIENKKDSLNKKTSSG